MDYLTLATSLIEEFKPSAIAIAEDIRDEG